jgi:LacI family transcriptional regulator, galactose operon repressor
MARVTLMDVARHCGVSRATVSLVLNNSPLVADTTAERVRQAMAELGYVYNRAAASLRTHRSDAIGVVLTQITNPYFAEFAAGLQDTLTDSGTVALLAVSDEDRGLQRRLMRSLVERNVDGIVLIPAHGTTTADLPDLLGTPLVLMARRLPGADVDYVGAQNREGGYAAAAHLWGHGCRTIAFLGGFADSSAREERAGGVSDFLAEQDRTLEVEWSCEPLRPQAREAAAAMLAGHPEVDGIVCFSDVVAFGLLDAIGDRGLRAGADVRVIGFDDVHDAGLNRPSLSSVAVPARETGRRAAQLVLDRAKGSAEPAVHEEFPVKLQPRETCGCPRPQT